LLRREEIEQFMADAPEFYHPEVIQ
jgi:hypothetical protein